MRIALAVLERETRLDDDAVILGAQRAQHAQHLALASQARARYAVAAPCHARNVKIKRRTIYLISACFDTRTVVTMDVLIPLKDLGDAVPEGRIEAIALSKHFGASLGALAHCLARAGFRPAASSTSCSNRRLPYRCNSADSSSPKGAPFSANAALCTLVPD